MPPPSLAALQAQILALQTEVTFLKGEQESSDEAESSDPDEASLIKPKIEPPKVRLTEAPTPAAYRDWKQSVQLWYAARVKFATKATLGAELVLALEGAPRQVVFASVNPEDITALKVLKALDTAYMADAVVELAEAKERLSTLERKSGITLLAFLTEYDLARTQAKRLGFVPDLTTEGLDLISACDLPPQVHSGIFADLSKKGSVKPTYNKVRKSLLVIARAEGLKKRERETRKGKKEKPTLITNPEDGQKDQPWKKGKGKGKGKGQWQGKWQGKIQKKGKGKGKGQSWSGEGKKKQVCKFHLEGKCTRGASCWFSHEKPVLQANVWKPGDWECPLCKAHNFASRQVCFKCEGKGERAAAKATARGRRVPRSKPSRDSAGPGGQPPETRTRTPKSGCCQRGC